MAELTVDFSAISQMGWSIDSIVRQMDNRGDDLNSMAGRISGVSTRRGYLGSHAGDNLLKRVERVSGTGLIYVRGESDDSYDSRYYGFVAPEYIKARIVPLTVSERPLWPIGNIRNLSSEKE